MIANQSRKGDRRMETDRRIYSYTFHIPEQRGNRDRRRKTGERKSNGEEEQSRSGFLSTSLISSGEVSVYIN